MNNKEIKLAIENKEYNKLHKEFMTTIKSLVKRYPQSSQEDLIQEASLALYLFLNKATRYNPRSWKSFIRQFLNSRIIEVVRKDTGLIKIPYNISRIIKALHKNPEATDEEIINSLKCNVKQLALAKRYKDLTYVSLEELREQYEE